MNTTEAGVYCAQVVTVPIGGGARFVKGCGRVADDEGWGGTPMCRQHADEDRYRVREAERLMATARRHWPSFGFGLPGSPNEKTKCGGCDELVPVSAWAAHEEQA